MLSLEIVTKAAFLWAGLWLVPFALELSRGSSTALALLPIGRRRLAISYWVLGVCVPVGLMAVVVGLLAIFEPNWASLRHWALTLAASLGVAGSSFWLLTHVTTLSETDEQSYAASFVAAVWLPAMIVGSLLQWFKSLPAWTSAAILAGLLGGAALGCARADRLILLRRRERRPGGFAKLSAKCEWKSKPGRRGLSPMFLNLAWQGMMNSAMLFLVALFFSATRYSKRVLFFGNVLRDGSQAIIFGPTHAYASTFHTTAGVILRDSALRRSGDFGADDRGDAKGRPRLVSPGPPTGAGAVGRRRIGAGRKPNVSAGHDWANGRIYLGGGRWRRCCHRREPASAIVGCLLAVVAAFFWNQHSLRSSKTYRVARTAWPT